MAVHPSRPRRRSGRLVGFLACGVGLGLLAGAPVGEGGGAADEVTAATIRAETAAAAPPRKEPTLPSAIASGQDGIGCTVPWLGRWARELGGDPWAGCPPGWQRVMVFCERAGHRKFLGRGWAHRFGDGFPAVASIRARSAS